MIQSFLFKFDMINRNIIKRTELVLAKKTLTVFLVGVFLFTNGLGWAQEEKLFSSATENKPFSSGLVNKDKLAPHTQLPDSEFREKFAMGEFLLSVDGVKHFIIEQVGREKAIFKNNWKGNRLETGSLDNNWYRGRIRGGSWGPKSVVFVKLAGFLASTGQPAWIDLDASLETSKEFGGIPVVYIDSMLAKKADACLEKHEIDEILQWEYFRINVLNIPDKQEMGNWIRRYINSSDSRLDNTEYKGMDSRQIAQLFHGYAYSLRGLYDKLSGTTDFDYGYIKTLLQIYGCDEKEKYPNIAAHEPEKAGSEDNRRNMSRVWKALDAETPVIDESSKWSIRLYFLGQGLHMYINMGTSNTYTVYVSNMGNNHTYPGYRYNGENPGEEIAIKDKLDRELLNSKVITLLKRLRNDKGISDFLRVVEVNEEEKERMASLKNKNAREAVTSEDERAQILKELNPLLDIGMEQWTPEQVDRMQQLVSALGCNPLYTAEKKHPDNWPSHPMDRNIYNIKQGDVIYIQYGVMSRNNEEEVTEETKGLLQKVPSFSGGPVVTMTDGREVNLNQAWEIIVGEGRGGHYKVDRETGGMDPYCFLMGGYLERRMVQGELIKGAHIVQEGTFKGMVEWPGVDKNLPIKFVTRHKVTKQDAWNRMTGEKITVLETPGEQNNGVFMYKRANGRFGDHDMVDINRIIHLGVDSEIAQLNTHQFRKGDRVVIEGEDRYYDGVVENFYTQAFVDRRMAVKIDNPPNPEKPYVHVKFVNELEAVAIGAKNSFAKTQIPASFEKLYDTINSKFIIGGADLLEQHDQGEIMVDFWERFQVVYDALFGSGKMFEQENFNIAALDSVFQSGIGMTLEEMVNGITGAANLESNNPLCLIRGLLNESEKEGIKRAYHEIRIGLSLFAGRAVASTGTIPWVVKERDLTSVADGKLPESDFTITALLRYFDNDTYPTFADKIGLAHKIAGARERYSLQDQLHRLYENKDKIENLSRAAKEIVAEEYTKNLQDPDDISVVRFLLELEKHQFNEQITVTLPEQTTREIGSTLDILNKTIPEQEKQDEGRYYTVRYNTTKIPQGSFAEALLKVYVNEVMPLYMQGKGRVVLKPSESHNQSLLSVECYRGQDRSQRIGEGRVDIGEDINGKALRIIGMMNMALVASHIPTNTPSDEIKAKYGNLVSLIERQYKEISGIDCPETVWQDTSKGICIVLPHAAPVSLEKVDEYYRLTIRQLQEAA